MSNNQIIVYEESFKVPWFPLVFFLPIFYKYGVIITDKEIQFGYGFSKPMAIVSKTIPFENIKKETIKTGFATWNDNLTRFGGWGIKLSLDGTIAYNAKNGDYLELTTTRGYTYRLVSNDVQTVASLLGGESNSASSGDGNIPVDGKENDGLLATVVSDKL